MQCVAKGRRPDIKKASPAPTENIWQSRKQKSALICNTNCSIIITLLCYALHITDIKVQRMMMAVISTATIRIMAYNAIKMQEVRRTIDRDYSLEELHCFENDILAAPQVVSSGLGGRYYGYTWLVKDEAGCQRSWVKYPCAA